MTDHDSLHILVSNLQQRLEVQKELIAAYQRREELQEDRYRMMVVKVENLRTDLRRALDSIRREEEIND